MNLYSSTAIDNLVSRYVNDNNGTCTQLEEGVLGHGKLILEASGKKTIIVTEVFMNEWSSGHKIRMYNRTPKKYN